MEVVVLAIGVVAILFALFQGIIIKRKPVEDKEIARIGSYIANGAKVYLKRQYTILAIFIVVVAVALIFVPTLGWKAAITFLVGAAFSIAAGYVGMDIATAANQRTAEGAKKGVEPAFKVAFSGGLVMGLIVVGLGCAGVTATYLIFKDISILTGFSLGASFVALFCRVGGGIYTKAADVGADLVGKVESHMLEDDIRNPAVIADNVGDNVGDVAGMGADLFESYVGCIVSSILLAVAVPEFGLLQVLLIVGAGIISSIIGAICVKVIKNKNVQLVLNLGTYISGIVFLIAAFFITRTIGENGLKAFLAILCGTIAGIIIGKVTEIYTSDKYKPVKGVVEAGRTGEATNILAGMSLGMRSVVIPIIIVVINVLLAYLCYGMLGIALSAVGMLATVGIVISVDAYGPISDNAGGIASMSKQAPEVREITDGLDSIGNTTAAIGKGFSIGSAALTAISLFASYAATVKLDTLNVLNPNVLAGVFIGGMLPFLFCALTISSVHKAAKEMIVEVRNQFKKMRENEGNYEPDYKKCIDISTSSAIKEMIIPGVLAVVVPVLVGVILGKEALGGLLVGATIVGVLLAIYMSNAGGAWDNAKKYVEGHEEYNETDKGVAVVGDTVGDPLKDTAGPSLNILIKLMSIVAVVFAPLFM